MSGGKFWVLALLSAAQAAAAPTIDVRARTRVSVDAVVRTGAGVHIRGTLADATTGEGVVGRHVLLEIDGGQRQVTTVAGPGGRFDATVDVPAGTHEVAARFSGDESYGESATLPRAYDVDKATIAVSVRIDGPVDSAAREAVAHLTATSNEGPEIVPLVVRAGDAGGAALQTVGTVPTDSRGEAILAIPRAVLGAPGPKRVIVRFEGSNVWNPAEDETTFFVQASTKIVDLKLPTAPVAFEDDLVVAGRLVEGPEGTDKPVSKAVVVLAIGGKRVQESVTDETGRFELRTDASDYGPGTVQLTVAYDSSMPWRRGARLGPYPVEIAKPEPVPLSYTLLTFALTAAAVVGYVLLRTRPWVRLAAAVRRRRRKPDTAMVVPPASSDDAAPVPGLRLARPSFISSLRRAADHGFTGRVTDVVRGQPIGGARLVLTSGPEKRELVADENGHFETLLPSGWWLVEVSAHGYVTESIRAPIPHRGELRGARIDLLPVREKVFAIYRQIAAPLLPKPELWGVWTPREILDHARSVRPDGEFGQLTSLVEETYFSVRTPDETVVAAAQARASAAARELTA